MSEMFRNYPQPDDYIPDNHPRCHKHPKLEIMCGETVNHTFEVPFNIDETTSRVEVIYKLGLTNVLIKTNENIEIVSEDNHSIINVVITPEETLSFAHSLLDTSVQIKFVLKDNNVSFSEIYEVVVRDSLVS